MDCVSMALTICQAVVICGVNLSLSPMTYISCCGAGPITSYTPSLGCSIFVPGMHSHLGRCFTYNFSADGYTRGEDSSHFWCLNRKVPQVGPFFEATASCALKLKAFERCLRELKKKCDRLGVLAVPGSRVTMALWQEAR